AQAQAGDDGAHDGAHTTDHHNGKHHDDQVGAHQWRNLHDRRCQYSGKAGQCDAEAVSQGDHQRNIHAKGFHQLGVFSAGAKQRTQASFFDHEPGGEADYDGRNHNPGTVYGQVHEAQIDAPLEQCRGGVRLAGHAVETAENAFQQKSDAKGEQQPIKVVQLIEVPDQCFFQDDAEDAHEYGRHDQHDPVIEAEVGQAHPGEEGAQHVQGAVGKINDVKEAENDGEAQRQDSIKGAIDQAQQYLAQQRLNGDAEEVSHIVGDP